MFLNMPHCTGVRFFLNIVAACPWSNSKLTFYAMTIRLAEKAILLLHNRIWTTYR